MPKKTTYQRAHPLVGLLASTFLLALIGSTPVWADADAADADTESAIETEAPAPKSETEPLFPALPEGIASFGAALLDGELFVYGGHVGRTHHHSIDNLSKRFLHLELDPPGAAWQEEAPVKGLQGLALVAHGQEVCRVGGLDAHNRADAEEEDLHSVAEVRCFDAGTATWRDLPPLPAPRSSHDALAVDGRLWVVGGWQLRGEGQESTWHDTLLSLDLDEPGAEWVSIPQPFQRRALALAAWQGKLYALGGLSGDGTSQRVDIYDPSSQSWSEGPDVPAVGRMKGFGLAALGIEAGPAEGLWLTAADGALRRLVTSTDGAPAWSEPMATLLTPRFFHRMVADEGHFYFVGGASREGHLADVERIPFSRLETAEGEPSSASETETSEMTSGAPDARGSWPGFRGDGRGRSTELPRQWSESRGLAWSAELPGYGQSSPVIWDGRAIVTSAQGEHKEELVLSAFELDTGEVHWRRIFPASQQLGEGVRAEMVSRAAPTPVVDGERIYAFWESGDLLAVDHRGETLWHRSLTEEYGPFAGNHGVASSPVLGRDALLVQVTHDGPSYYLAVDKASGETLWKTDRPDGVAWTTPSLVVEGAQELLISSAAGRLEALDTATGEVLWQLDGIEKNAVPSAVIDGDRVIVASSAPGQSFALRRPRPRTKDPDATDDVLWRAEGVSSGFGSPAISGPCVLFVNKSGTATCVDRADGHVRWRHRLGEAIWASPVVAGEDVYFFGKGGETVVLRAGADGPEQEVRNVLPTEQTVYGVAAADQALLIRTGERLLCIRETPSTPAAQEQVAAVE